ncbi:MAG: 50S ribosomal protein L10 [Pyrinomonadaceae bacterium]
MKSRETKAKDLAALTESLQNSTSAMVVSFSKLTVTKDQEFRNSLREAGASYQVVKNTLARIAVKGTQFEDATEHFKGVTAIAWTQNDPVVLSKAISKFMKDNADIYTFKTGVVDGKLVDLKQLTTIASLPSKEELISKLMWVLNSGAQRLVTVINAVPRDLAVVIKQIGEQEGRDAGTSAEAALAAEAKPEDAAPAVQEAPAAEEAPAVEAEAAPAEQEAAVEAPGAEETPLEIEAAPAEEASAATDDEGDVLEIAEEAPEEKPAE